MIAKEHIIEKIAGQFESMLQWKRSNSLNSAAKYQNRAEVLIELLEVDDCGSVGGFGDENWINKMRTRYDGLFARFLYYAIQHQAVKIDLPGLKEAFKL